MNALLLYCRPGFEKECVAEIQDLAATLGAFGWTQLKPNSGFVLYECDMADAVYRQTKNLVFSRECWPVFARLSDLDSADRLNPILAGIQQYVEDNTHARFGQVSVENAEGDAYRSTARFAGKFQHPLRQALRQQGLISKKNNPALSTLRLFFTDSSEVFVGRDLPDLRSAWPMGVARLKFPPQAPSRSTLKLEEAFIVFLGSDWRETLQKGNTAVDLGAAPGGWTWQLVNQGLYTYAVDNGPMDKALMGSGLVEHVQEDGFVWRPDRKVDWLVCDMVEQPIRVANLMVEWLHQKHANYALFNLKLPMKKRYQEWLDISEQLQAFTAEKYPKAVVRAKHLYHDREEITVFLDLANQNG